MPPVRLFLWKLAESNNYILDRTYFETTLFEVGGPLSYAAAAATSLLACPWTAMPGIALVWIVLTALARWIWGVRAGPWEWLAALPGALSLALLAHMGFGIWISRFPDLFFQVGLGLIVTMASYGFAQGRSLGIAVAMAPALYLLGGAWAFFFSLAIFVRVEIFPEGSSVPRRFLAAVPLLLVAVFPYLLIRLNFLVISPFEAYTRHLLLFRGDNQVWNVIFIVLVLISLILPAARRAIRLPANAWVSLLAALVFLSFIGFAAERSPQLGELLAMEKAAKEGRWADILSCARAEQLPHRMMSAYRILAMYKTDCVAQDLFAYPMTTTHRATPVDTVQMNGALMYYEYGLVLNARKVLMEEVVEFGMSAERLRLLGMIACVTAERAAAGMYFERLANVPFRRREAERWLRVIRAQEKPPADVGAVATMYETFRKTAPLLFFGSETRLEEDIYSSYQRLRDCPTNMAVLCLCIHLLEKTPEKLALNLDAMRQLQTNRQLPRALQEGLLFHLVRTMNQAERDRFDYAAAGISRQTQERWNEFLSLRDALAAEPARLRAAMQESFGTTYWYYHAFTP
jgi:hypothetical protein